MEWHEQHTPCGMRDLVNWKEWILSAQQYERWILTEDKLLGLQVI
jgi:hypothetical protein